MKLTVTIKLLPSISQRQYIMDTMQAYVALVNQLVDDALAREEWIKQTSKTVIAPLPSAVKNQAIKDAKSVYTKCTETNIHHVLHKPIAMWNNQNYTIGDDYIAFPMLINGKSRRFKVNACIVEEALAILRSHKLGALRITVKGRKLIAQVAYKAVKNVSSTTGVMGVDLGIKCPAVAVTDSGNVRFFGSGKQRKYIRRKFHSYRKKLSKAKKARAISKSKHKERNWMRNQDHKISREIVNYAIQHNIGTIKLEQLTNIRATTRRSRKNNRSLHSWSFYRLTQFIEYKAKLAGITVVYVNPAYTSQICPQCGAKHHAKDRLYKCKCGYRSHRDLVGARNILVA